MVKRQMKNENLNEAVNPTLDKADITPCGLSAPEYYEKEMLLEKQIVRPEAFSQENFDRLKELKNKMYPNEGPPKGYLRRWET